MIVLKLQAKHNRNACVTVLCDQCQQEIQSLNGFLLFRQKDGKWNLADDGKFLLFHGGGCLSKYQQQHPIEPDTWGTYDLHFFLVDLCLGMVNWPDSPTYQRDLEEIAKKLTDHSTGR